MKTYTELKAEHATNEFGIITDPGKFAMSAFMAMSED